MEHELLENCLNKLANTKNNKEARECFIEARTQLRTAGLDHLIPALTEGYEQVVAANLAVVDGGTILT
jgi:hypothetical protein